MLILTRRPNERIIINGNIIIELLGIKGNQARLGIDAPRDIVVHREEIHKRIDKEKNSDTSHENGYNSSKRNGRCGDE